MLHDDHTPETGERTSSEPEPSFGRRFSFQVLAPVLAAVCLLFLTDATVFRTDLYQHLLSPDSYAGRIRLLTRHLRTVTWPEAESVLIMGDSRIAEGFSGVQATKEAGAASIRFLSGAVPGSTTRVWYYLLREIDPAADRFTAVILPCMAYDDWETAEDYSNRMLDIRLLTPLIRLGDLIDFAVSFPSGDRRKEAFVSTLLKGYAFKSDVQDFLHSPKRRFRQLAVAADSWVSSHDSYAGKSESLAGADYDSAADRFVFPERVSAEQRRRIERDARPAAARRGNLQARYQREWFGRIADHYRGSSTRLFVIRPPRGPLTQLLPATTSGIGAVRLLEQSGRVRLLPEETFTDLEQPQFFADALHLNHDGRDRFTRHLAREMVLQLGHVQTRAEKRNR